MLYAMPPPTRSGAIALLSQSRIALKRIRISFFISPKFYFLFFVILPSWDFNQFYHSAFRRKQQVMAWRKLVWQAFLKLFSTFSVFLSSLLGSLFCIPPSFPGRNSNLSIRLNTKKRGMFACYPSHSWGSRIAHCSRTSNAEAHADMQFPVLHHKGTKRNI